MLFWSAVFAFLEVQGALFVLGRWGNGRGRWWVVVEWSRKWVEWCCKFGRKLRVNSNSAGLKRGKEKGNGYLQKDKIKAKPDKTEHEMESVEKSEVNQKSTQSKSKMEPSQGKKAKPSTSLDRKSTTGGCQFIRSRLISWQCKKQTVVATSTNEAKYVKKSSMVGFSEMIQYHLTTGLTKLMLLGKLTTVIDVNDVEEKSTESEGFEQIIDFLNANPIKYALTVNPMIYTLCIKKFWATAKVKFVNGEEHIQTLVDKKKVIITEISVRSDLHLEYTEGTECLPTATIFEQLTLMGAKTTAWNEFSSTMASSIICLATNQKFNFSKYIYDHMVKNLEGGIKFLMFSRFVQVFLDSQVEGMLKHKEIYVTPSHTKKIFANMKRHGKDFSDKHETTTSNDPLLSGEDRLKLTELVELCTQLQLRVLALETTKANQALEIESLKRRVKKLEKKASKKYHKLKRLYKIGSSTRMESSKDAGLGDQEDASKQGRMIEDLDADKGVALEVSTADPVPTAGEVVTTAGVEVSTAAITSKISMDEITLAKALIDIKTSKPKAKGIVMQEPSETPNITPIDASKKPSKAKDKGKAKMIKPKKPLKRKDPDYD
nr:ribonuclease H-like domain-containing protein [Tanacetum cinerariifolium]